MKYTTLLMDADDTIFDFPKCEYNALQEALTSCGFPFDDSIHAAFSAINSALWKQFEMNRITRAELRVERFRSLMHECFQDLSSPNTVADRYVEALSKQAIFIDGAKEAVQTLSKHFDIFIITNGLKAVQKGRFARAGLDDCLKGLFISDEMGVQKPMKAFFDRVMTYIPEKESDRILVVGDSLTSDMQGGRNAGLDTCLYDPLRKTTLPHPLCDYRIERLTELISLSE